MGSCEVWSKISDRDESFRAEVEATPAEEIWEGIE
jgi:hypothetical protein